MPLGDLLRRLGGEFAPQAVEKGLDLTVVETGIVVYSDPLLLERILRNLISNAIRYTDRGRVLIGCRRHGAKVTVEIWDTGIGIPPDRLAHVFTPFEQVEAMAARPTAGTGLGLAIAKQLSELMGGRMWVESALGQGSTFHFTICVAAAPGSLADTLAEDTELAFLRGQHLLIVDRHARSRRALCAYAHAIGMRASVAGAAEQALALAEAGARFDLAAIDLRDAEVAGKLLGNVLRERYGMPGLRLLGMAPLGLSDSATSSGAFDLLVHKPLKLSQLREALIQAAR
jgi:CheY-like chemotaxis protein